jgi:hypothetical protein
VTTQFERHRFPLAGSPLVRFLLALMALSLSLPPAMGCHTRISTRDHPVLRPTSEVAVELIQYSGPENSTRTDIQVSPNLVSWGMLPLDCLDCDTARATRFTEIDPGKVHALAQQLIDAGFYSVASDPPPEAALRGTALSVTIDGRRKTVVQLSKNSIGQPDKAARMERCVEVFALEAIGSGGSYMDKLDILLRDMELHRADTPASDGPRVPVRDAAAALRLKNQRFKVGSMSYLSGCTA